MRAFSFLEKIARYIFWNNTKIKVYEKRMKESTDWRTCRTEGRRWRNEVEETIADLEQSDLSGSVSDIPTGLRPVSLLAYLLITLHESE